MNLINLTKKLISIPSYVDKITDENRIGEFINNFLKQNTKLKIQTQKVDSRFNILATQNEVQLLFIGHTDTVPPKNQKQLSPVIKKGRIYGLGATDMKGGLACILNALVETKNLNGIGFLFYVGEEYDFAGMSKFISSNKIKPQLVVSADGTDLKIGDCCRSLFEVNFKIKGKTAPAYKEHLGRNPILFLGSAISSLKEKYPGSSINLAYIEAGLKFKNKIINQPNCVPNFAKGTLDIRPYNATGGEILKNLKILLKKQNLIFTYKINFNLPGWKTEEKNYRVFREIVKKQLETTSIQDPRDRGYIDIALLANKLSIPCIDFGPGLTAQAHVEDEFVNIKNLKVCQRIFKKLIEKFIQ